MLFQVTFKEYLQRKRETEPRFDSSELSLQFAPHFETGQRIKVEMSIEGTRTGTVGVTTGWRPVFLLMSRSNARSSSMLLSDKDRIIAVKRGNRYVPIGKREE